MYKTTNTHELLNKDIIIHNLIETSKISDPIYIMSASTAWFRMHPGKTFYDLQAELKRLKLQTLIIPKGKDDNYRLCVPGNAAIEDQLKYESTFISSPTIAARTKPASPDQLKLTGFSCSNGYKFPIILPNIKKLQGSNDIHAQLQWAAIKFSVDYVVVNPDDELRKDLSKLENQEYMKCLLFNTADESLYAYINTETRQCVSEFGVLVKPSENGNAKSELVVHLPTYLNA